jgi:hypothetical protein
MRDSFRYAFRHAIGLWCAAMVVGLVVLKYMHWESNFISDSTSFYSFLYECRTTWSCCIMNCKCCT